MDAATAIRRYWEITRRGPIACSEEEDKERRELAEWMSKNLPAETVETSRLYSLQTYRCRKTIEYFEQHPDHAPVVVIPGADDMLEVIDGTHRMIAACLQKRSKIRVVFASERYLKEVS